MKLSALLVALLTTLVAAEPCTSTASNKPTLLPELCTRICASSPIEDCGRGWASHFLFYFIYRAKLMTAVLQAARRVLGML